MNNLGNKLTVIAGGLVVLGLCHGANAAPQRIANQGPPSATASAGTSSETATPSCHSSVSWKKIEYPTTVSETCNLVNAVPTDRNSESCPVVFDHLKRCAPAGTNEEWASEQTQFCYPSYESTYRLTVLVSEGWCGGIWNYLDDSTANSHYNNSVQGRCEVEETWIACVHR